MTSISTHGDLHASRADKAVGLPFLTGFTLANLGFYIAVLTPIAITLAIRVQAIDPAGKGASLGLILGAGSFFALIANPICGQLSDRTRSRFGRRRPWIVGGSLIGALAQGLIANSDSLLTIGIAWCVVQAAYNAMLAALVAVVPDQVPERQRGTVSALAGMAIYVGLLIGSAIVSFTGTTGNAMFWIPAVVGLVFSLGFALILDDAPVQNAGKTHGSGLKELASSFYVNPIRHPDFGYAWLSRFLVCFGFAVLTSYQVYYLIDQQGVTEASVGATMFTSTLITTIAVVVGSSLSGLVSDRLGRRKPFVFAAASTYALGIGIITLAPSLTMFFVGVAVSSLGFGVYMAVDQALVVDVLPDRETNAAKNMGVFNIANAVPQSIAPALAPIFLSIGSAAGQNYTMLYFAAAVSAFLGALAIVPVRGTR